MKYKTYKKRLLLAFFMLATGIVATNRSLAQTAKSECVVTKVGNPAGPQPTLPPGCEGGSDLSVGDLVYPPGMTGPNDKGYYQLPQEYIPGTGYTTIVCANHLWGSKTLVGLIYTVAKKWKEIYPNGHIRIGDLNAAGHLTHKWGVAFDIDASTDGTDCVAGYINNGGMGRNCASRYNRAATVELAKILVNTKLIKNVLYMDTSVNSTMTSYVRANNIDTNFYEIARHDDHFHVDLLDTYKITEWEPGC